ncbi:MAG: bifunctional DNA-formamidopyrimidine glycosylase/DNA-(apurinic or apyrimidinic site) lyase [Gaiellaceae bacterium]
MPELPEVESIRRSLEPLIAGRRIVRAEILDPRLVQPEPASAIAGRLAGERIATLGRRGKYLIVGMESGRSLVVHLRMTGSLRRLETGSPADSYRRAWLELDDGSRLDYRDVRRFGTWRLLEAGELESYLADRLGLEPLEPAFTPEALAERLRRRRAPVKAALLDQRTVAGLGNIYVDEALWRARLHPARPAGSLGKSSLTRLHESIREVLEIGIARQGATLRDYSLPDGESGSMQREFRVYGRDGEPCERCGTAIAKTRIGGRGTWFCPRCQRRRDRRDRS